MTYEITLISDTHNYHNQLSLKGGDILIVAGDFTGYGYKHQVESFFKFLNKMQSLYTYIVFIAGNHDRCFDPKYYKEYKGDDPTRKPQWLVDAIKELTQDGHIIYLENSGVEVMGLSFWGSPITPWFGGDRWAFNRHRGDSIDSIWKNMPTNLDFLITHGPPHMILDRTRNGEYVGCERLSYKIAEVQPKMHIFGHIHEGYGFTHNSTTEFYNASQCNEYNEFKNRPIYITYEK